MRLSRRRRPATVGMDMTPMIDVVFQLIIFFMTVSQQSQLDTTPVELPKLAGLDDQRPKSITINIAQGDRLIVAGDPIDLAALEVRITREVVSAGGRPELVEVVLRVDRRTDSALVNRVMSLLKRSGITHTRIAVEVPGTG